MIHLIRDIDDKTTICGKLRSDVIICNEFMSFDLKDCNCEKCKEGFKNKPKKPKYSQAEFERRYYGTNYGKFFGDSFEVGFS